MSLPDHGHLDLAITLSVGVPVHEVDVTDGADLGLAILDDEGLRRADEGSSQVCLGVEEAPEVRDENGVTGGMAGIGHRLDGLHVGWTRMVILVVRHAPGEDFVQPLVEIGLEVLVAREVDVVAVLLEEDRARRVGRCNGADAVLDARLGDDPADVIGDLEVGRASGLGTDLDGVCVDCHDGTFLVVKVWISCCDGSSRP